MSQSQVTQSYNTKKDIKGFKTDNIIQYNNSMLALWSIHRLKNKVCTQTIVYSI